jgi:hypothetical protein
MIKSPAEGNFRRAFLLKMHGQDRHQNVYCEALKHLVGDLTSILNSFYIDI